MSISYTGNDPYIFVSYSHRDGEMAGKVIDSLIQSGYRVWYDNGIEAGSEWPEYIAERLMSCSVVLILMSANAQDSHNCRREIHFSIDLNKELLVAYIDEVVLTPGLRLQLSPVQAIYKHKSRNEQEFLNNLCSASILKPCLDEKVANNGFAHETSRQAGASSQARPEASFASSSYSTGSSSSSSSRSSGSSTGSSSSSYSSSSSGAFYQNAQKSERQMLLAATQACNEAMREGKLSWRFKPPQQMNEKQINNAIKKIANGITESQIVSIMDDTIMESGKSGYVITETTLYSGIWLFHFSLPITRVVDAQLLADNYILLKFDTGASERYFFSTYCKAFFALFQAYLKEKGLA